MSDIDEILQETKQKLKDFVQAVKDHPSKFTPSTGTLWSILRATKTEPKAPSRTGIYGYAEHVFGWIALNPNDLERGRALVSTYHLPGFPDFDPANSTLECLHPISCKYGNNGFETTRTIPSFQGLLSLFDCVTISRNQFISISGRRGSGKTMALNFFLATAHKKLEKEGVLWFRTDIAKLWANRNSLNITQYTILHSIFIALKYAYEDENLKPMISIDNVPGKLFKDFLDTPLINLNIRNMWGELVKAFNWAIRFNKEKPVTEFLRQCKNIINKDADSKNTIIDIYVVFKTFLKESAKEQGRRNLKILIILDGVDNVRVGAEHDRYYEFLDEINDLHLGVPIEVGDQYILVARPETFMDLTNQQTSKGYVCSASSVFDIDTDFISGLVEKKEKALLNPSEYFRGLASLYDGEKHITQEDLKDFSDSIKFLFNTFEEVGKQSQLSNRMLEDVKPLDMIFDGNIRSMLRNAIRAHYHKKRLPNVKVERALIEGSILAGYTVPASNYDDSVHGRWCPNLFEDATYYQGKWTGLIMVRLIQLLSAVRDGVTSDDAIKFLQKNFSYEEERIKRVIQAATEFSLIRAIDFVPVFDDKLGRTRNHPIFSTTLKGRYILKMGLEDYGIYYLMALATPLDLNKLLTLKNIDFRLMIHSDSHSDGDLDRHFFRSAILLGMTLWAHIQVTEQKEYAALLAEEMPVDIKRGTMASKSAFEMKRIIDNLPKLAEAFLVKIDNKIELKIVSETLEKLTN